MAVCSFRQCEREAVAEGLCSTHYKQKQRGRPLSAIHERGHPLVPLATRVPREVLDALGDRPGEEARKVLSAWARRRRAR